MVHEFLKAVCVTKLVFLSPALIPLAGLTVTTAVSEPWDQSPRPAGPGRRFVRGVSLVVAPPGAEKVFFHLQHPKKALGMNA